MTHARSTVEGPGASPGGPAVPRGPPGSGEGRAGRAAAPPRWPSLLPLPWRGPAPADARCDARLVAEGGGAGRRGSKAPQTELSRRRSRCCRRPPRPAW